jgi:hypothetical protein
LSPDKSRPLEAPWQQNANGVVARVGREENARNPDAGCDERRHVMRRRSGIWARTATTLGLIAYLLSLPRAPLGPLDPKHRVFEFGLQGYFRMSLEAP